MKRLLLVAALLPGIAVAQGVTKVRRPDPEVMLAYGWRGGTMTAQTIGGRVLAADRGATVTAIGFHVGTAAVTATGTMTLRVTDDTTNNCDAVIDCTSTDVTTTGPKRKAVTASLGSCHFAAASKLRVTIQAACGTAQPSGFNVDVLGTWDP